MDFDGQWLLFALPLAFALGWMAARLDLRQFRRETRDNPRAVFRGLSLLLNEQQDKAVDAFIEAVQHDPESAELHFALGNLFRRRGEFERAIRVHEHLLARADLSPQERARAQHALAQDFMRAGLFDRAEAAFRQLRGSPFEADADLALLSLHERARDWEAAIEVARRLQQAGRGSFATRLMHYECERALLAEARGDTEAQRQALERARQADPAAPRPWVMEGRRLAQVQQWQPAMQAFEELARVAPASFGLVADEYVQAARSCGQTEAARATVLARYASQPTMALLRALLRLEEGPGHSQAVHEASAGSPSASSAEESARSRRLLQHLQQAPSLSAALALLQHRGGMLGEAELGALRGALARAAEPVQRLRCAACGFEARHWFWQCPGCLGWDSFPPLPVEEQ